MKMRSRLLGAGVLAAAALALPGQALAGTGTVQGSELVYTAAAGEANDVTVSEAALSASAIEYTIEDPAGVTAGPSCAGSGTTLECVVVAPSGVRLVLANGNDKARSAVAGAVSVPMIVFGGPGNDVLEGGPDRDVLDGGDGNDDLLGRAGSDRALGGPGSDTLIGESGADRLEGGVGDDDGTGGIGDDALIGYLGNDTFDGGEGDDTLSGGAGDDKLFGSAGRDDLDGDAGNDSLTGGIGVDVMRGGRQADVLDGRDVAPGDTLSCGPDGFLDDDLARFDLGDLVNTDCEVQQGTP